MNANGDPRNWRELFPEGFLPDILTGIKASWNRMEKPSRTEIELRITRRLKHQLRSDPSIRRLPVRVEREFTLDDPDTGDELGRLDLCWLHGHNEDVCLAFECKRLNVPFPSGKESLAADYVGKEGMGCFVSGKYSAGHEHGGMIGYVMDGQITSAVEAVSRAVARNRERLSMPSDGCLSESSICPGDSEIGETVHHIPPVKLTLHHLFMPV